MALREGGMLHERIEVPAAEDLASVWLVIPGFNEGGAIGRTVRSVAHWLPNVVVDDGSTDDTGREAERAGAHLVRHCINLGQGAALATGIRYALLNGAR